MYHPTRGGVRGGRDQFTWDDVKVDKHRENYIGHSIKAPVGRWQKGKDLHWYTRDKKSDLDSEAMKDEIRRIKEEEEQAMREALGLAPKRASKSQGHRLDKHEFAELVKRGSTAEDVGAGHAEAAQVHGLGFTRGVSHPSEDPILPSVQKSNPMENPNIDMPQKTPARNDREESEDESSRKRKRRHEEKKRDKHEKHNKERRHHHDSDDYKRKHKKDRERGRHESK